jgi:hypothetical protein
MPTRSEVITSLIAKYNAQITDTESAVVETAVMKLAIAQLVDAAFSGGGTTIATVSDGIDASADIGTIVTRLTTIASNAALESGGNLAALAAWIATQRGFSSTQTITRPANTTPYVANSVWGGVFQLSAVGSANREAIITGVQVVFSNTSLPIGMGAFRLYLYSVTPPSAIADGGAFSLPSGDRASCLTPGGINLGTSALAVGGGSVILDTFATNSGSLNHQISVPANTNIFGYLVTVGAYTPVSASTAIVKLSTLGV